MNIHFWKDALERALKTAAQTAIATIGVGATFNDIDWALVFSTAGLSALLSVLMSFASREISGDKSSASLVSSEEEKKEE